LSPFALSAAFFLDSFDHLGSFVVVPHLGKSGVNLLGASGDMPTPGLGRVDALEDRDGVGRSLGDVRRLHCNFHPSRGQIRFLIQFERPILQESALDLDGVGGHDRSPGRPIPPSYRHFMAEGS
jgi:hypothetical protein